MQLLAQTEAAADTSEETVEAEIPQYYQVEMIVFRHVDQSGTTPEIPRKPEGEISEMLEQDLARLSGNKDGTDIPADALPLTEPASDELTQDDLVASDIDAEAPEEPEELPFMIPVAEGSLLLGGTARRIDTLEPYELVSYLHWAQPAPDVTVAKSLQLAELGADPNLLTGEVEVHQRRYLHLLIDINLNDEGATTEPVFNTADLQFLGTPSALPALKDSRRFRLEQIHYFDQPQFGVLAIISRYEFPQTEVVDEVGAADEITAETVN